MACIEIKFRDKIFKITNGTESDVFTASDYGLLYNFMTTGKVPDGYYVVGDNIDKTELFDYITNGLAEAKDNNGLFRDVLTNKSQDEFIDKLIGNRSINNIVGNESLTMDNNALVISDWGDSKNWYGFTQNRMVMITGDSMYANKYATNALSYIYANVRAGDKRYVNTINTLYEKNNGPKTDNIYHKLTWLANHSLRSLLDNTYTPNNSRYIPPANTTINKVLNTSISNVIGFYFKYNDSLYMIESLKTKNVIKARNLDTNNIEEINTKSVRSIYMPIIISKGNVSYYLMYGQWFTRSGETFNKVNQSNSEALFNDYFGIDNTVGERINTYSIDIKGEHNILNELSEGTAVRTATSVYQKQGNIYTNGESELDPSEKIYEIRTVNDGDTGKIRTLMELEPTDKSISPNDTRIILYDHYGITDFNDISFTYDDKAPVVSVSTRSVTNESGQIITRPKLLFRNNILSTLDNCAEVTLAINYYNMLLNEANLPADVANARKF